MGYSRSMTVNPDAAGFYHCISRCVRRAWLCGEDPVSGQNFDHRRAWIERRLIDLADSFAVGLFAWAVMSNHTHVVLRIDPALPRTWSDETVAWRWARLSRTLAPKSDEKLLAQAHQLLDQPDRLNEVRRRLGSVSWFMRFLNECIARHANAEDQCTGRFWEGRFKCQALLDEPAVLACMAYVDLNPVRAGLADDPEGSDFTTVQRRIRALAGRTEASATQLEPVAGEPGGAAPALSSAGYVDLVDWTARMVRPDSRSGIRTPAPAALSRIRGSPDWWVGNVFRIEGAFGNAVGLRGSLIDHAAATGRRRLRGL